MEFSVSGVEIENAKAYIIGSIADMQPMLVDEDYNVPKEEKAFQKVKDDRIWSSCNFKKGSSMTKRIDDFGEIKSKHINH